MNDYITFTGDLTERQIYDIWLAFTNGGEESPIIETEGENLVLKVADNQEYCIVTGTDKDGDTALQIAEAICRAGDVITQLKNENRQLRQTISRMCDGVSRILRECDFEEANEGEVMYFVSEEWLRGIIEKDESKNDS